MFSFFNYFFSSLFCPCHLITKVCESLLRYTCMNVVCKIEHIKKTMIPPSKEKKGPKKSPLNFFSFFHFDIKKNYNLAAISLSNFMILTNTREKNWKKICPPLFLRGRILVFISFFCSTFHWPYRGCMILKKIPPSPPAFSTHPWPPLCPSIKNINCTTLII